MPAQDMPAAEVDIDEVLVRALLTEQHPDLADLPLALVANGWDNAIVRLGADLLVRLPRRAAAVPLVEHEQRWLPNLAPRLPLPIPAPVRVGRPSERYPWPWSIVPWFEGDTALASPPADPLAAARSLGAFFAALHRPAPSDAPVNPYRGIPLADRDGITRDALGHLDGIDRADVLARWAQFVDLPRWDGPPLWLHGDPHPGNVLVRDGRISAVIDFGDITSGDPASDLAVAWMYFPPAVRPAFRAAVGTVDDATWQRAHGWALAFGLALSAHAADNPTYAALGEHVLRAALADTSL